MNCEDPRLPATVLTAMCGIAGTIDHDAERGRRRVEALCDYQLHRGPDHSAVSVTGSVALGYTRLAIQDPTPAGNQPLVSDTGRYVCVFNGEIYNFRELGRQYGLTTGSGSDGAVIPPLWELMREQCLGLLRGMWSIAVMDTEQSTVTLARDPFGIKPLYIRSFQDGSMAFASEARALARLAPRPAIEAAALAGYFRFGAMAPETSPWAGIRPLVANSWTRLGQSAPAGSIEEEANGWVLAGPHPLTAGGEEARPWDELLKSVELHLIADVPTALLLSAGVDSTLIACAAERLGHSLDCFTVQIPGGDDESAEAARTAQMYGHRHHLVPATLSEEDVEVFFACMQRPTVDGLNSFLVSKAIREAGYRVALSGLGGDEAVAGYPHMRYYPAVRVLRGVRRIGLAKVLSRIPTRRKISALVRPDTLLHAVSFDRLFRELLPIEVVQELFPSYADDQPMGEDKSLQALIESEVEMYLQRTLLPDADAFSMKWSVELRVPFLDVPYFRAAAASARPLRGKRPLARAAHDRRVDEIRRRRKRGFSLPMTRWMDSGPITPAIDRLHRRDAPIWDLIDRERALHTIDCEPPGRWAVLWAFSVLNQWLVSNRADPVL